MRGFSLQGRPKYQSRLLFAQQPEVGLKKAGTLPEIFQDLRDLEAHGKPEQGAIPRLHRKQMVGPVGQKMPSKPPGKKTEGFQGIKRYVLPAGGYVVPPI